MRSITCGTTLISPGSIEVFDFGRIRLRDIKHMENYAECFQRVQSQDDAYQGGIAGPGMIRHSRRATCELINRFMGPCVRERSDSMRASISGS